LHNYIDNRAGFPNISDDGITALQKAIEPTADVLRKAHAHRAKVVFARMRWLGRKCRGIHLPRA